MDNEEDIKLPKLSPLAKKLLKGLFYITAAVILCILMFYKGMIYQCHLLDMDAYTAEGGWIGFECRADPKISVGDYNDNIPIKWARNETLFSMKMDAGLHEM